MSEQSISLQEAATKALLATTMYSALLSSPSFQPKPYYIPQSSPGKKIESVLALVAQENPFFDYNVTLSLVNSGAFLKRSAVTAEVKETVAERFHWLAAEWSKETRHVSSLTAMVKHQKYREIVAMGMDVVPFLVIDLERNRRFWFPALREITGIRPYDSSDEGNPKRMMQSWIQWGRNKNYLQK